MYDKNGREEQRVTMFSETIGKYLIRASVLLYVVEKAEYLCHWLNQMVFDRTGVMASFKVVSYKGSSKTWVVARAVVANDLTSGIDESIEVKQR
jgi:hypothetical protein